MGAETAGHGDRYVRVCTVQDLLRCFQSACLATHESRRSQQKEDTPHRAISRTICRYPAV